MSIRRTILSIPLYGIAYVALMLIRSKEMKELSIPLYGISGGRRGGRASRTTFLFPYMGSTVLDGLDYIVDFFALSIPLYGIKTQTQNKTQTVQIPLSIPLYGIGPWEDILEQLYDVAELSIPLYGIDMSVTSTNQGGDKVELSIPLYGIIKFSSQRDYVRWLTTFYSLIWDPGSDCSSAHCPYHSFYSLIWDLWVVPPCFL